MLKAIIYNKNKHITIIKNDGFSNYDIKKMEKEEIDRVFCESDNYTINEQGYLLESKNSIELLQIGTKSTGTLKVWVNGILKYYVK
ncbi:MAG: hypothetical protein SO253_02655 [Bacilli bacterium]|nr:hypothetical protein [Bacilli bacterium]